MNSVIESLKALRESWRKNLQCPCCGADCQSLVWNGCDAGLKDHDPAHCGNTHKNGPEYGEGCGYWQSLAGIINHEDEEYAPPIPQIEEIRLMFAKQLDCEVCDNRLFLNASPHGTPDCPGEVCRKLNALWRELLNA